jgi:hypothetical protein
LRDGRACPGRWRAISMATMLPLKHAGAARRHDPLNYKRGIAI